MLKKKFYLGVLEEARFYGIEGAVSILEEMAKEEEKKEKDTMSLTRKDVLKAIMSTPSNSELRLQGVNLAGADLSRLDLRNINFKVKTFFKFHSSIIVFFCLFFYINLFILSGRKSDIFLFINRQRILIYDEYCVALHCKKVGSID